MPKIVSKKVWLAARSRVTSRTGAAPALRPSVLPLMTVAGMQLGYLIGGTVIVLEHFDPVEFLRLVERPQHRLHGRRADLVAALDELDQLVDDGARLDDVRLVTLERQPVAAQADRAVEFQPEPFGNFAGCAAGIPPLTGYCLQTEPSLAAPSTGGPVKGTRAQAGSLAL